MFNRYLTRLLFFSGALLAIFPTGVRSEALTLDECIRRGTEYNHEIKAYQLAVGEAEQGINEAWGDFLPTLSATYDKSSIFDSRGDGLETDYFDQDTERFTARVSQPLFSGFSGVAKLKQARQSKEYREYELRFMRAQLTREIRLSYFDILQANDLITKWSGSVQRLDEQQRIARAWVEQELAPRIRLLEVQVELSNAKQQLIVANSNRTIALARMKEFLAFSPDETFEISGQLNEEIVASCEEIDACTEQALSHRVDLKMMDLNVEMARQEAKAIIARNFPSARIDASWTDYQREYDNSILPDDARDYYSVALNLSIQPFQGGRNISAWRRQLLTVERFQSLKQSLLQSVVSEVNAQFGQLKQSFGLVETAKDSLVEATEAYQLVSRSAELGVTSLKDLLDAELRLTRAEISKVDAYHSLNQAFARLEYALGH